MKPIPRLTLLVTLVILLAGASFVVSAGNQKASPPGAQQQHAVPLIPDLSTNELLAKNYLTSGSPNVLLSSGFNFEDAGISFSCPRTTCTLVAESWATTGVPNAQPNNRALCLAVDGSIVGPCAYLGESAADGSYSEESAQNQWQVGTGAHTAFMYIYSDTGEYLYTYQNTYRLYAP
ncbi:MAG TPA: hypothetical protein VK555_05780 [Terriglobales bacterium]|nr:hypothetical protein [Terriglobales bacterium]